MTSEIKSTIHSSIRRNIRVALALIVFLLGGIAVWATATQISGAVIAPGSVVVDSNAKKVQHPTGGIVTEVHARDGDRVKAGDVLVRLDETVTRANLSIVSKALDQLIAQKARLETERDGLEDVPVPAELASRMNDPQVARIMEGERKLFSLRRTARVGQKDQLSKRVDQLKEELVGYESQERAKTREMELIEKQLVGARELWAKQLMPVTRFTELQRDAARLEGEHGVLIATMAQIKGKISETELQILQVDRDLNSDIGKEMREADTKIGELIERRVAAEDQLKRIEVRAPGSGVVDQSSVHTVGGVVAPGETIMLIVPDQDSLKVEAKVAPQDIDQLHIGQPVTLRFSGLDQRTTPVINGNLTQISPDTTVDLKTEQRYYTVRVSLEPNETARLGSVKIVPGMPVEVFVQTGSRSALSYLLKPLDDQISRAFKEQ
jgi:membrane fusion protein, type I secretion system